MPHTLIITSSENYGSRFIAHNTLGDASILEILGNRTTSLQDNVGAENLHSQSMAAGSRLQLINLDEGRLSQRRLRIRICSALLRLGL